MNSKVKGLLKGLRYISQIFEANTEEEEPEMQIGLPTDVKHVAHIGWDGPSVNSTPSWMTEFRNAPLSSLGAEAMGEINPTNLNQNVRIVQGSPLRDSRKAIVDSDSHVVPEPLPSKPGRRHALSNSGHDNPAAQPESPQSAPRQSRRNKSAEVSTNAESSDTDGQLEEPHRRSRRQHRVKESGAGNEAGLTTQDGPGIPKQVRKKKKPKGPSGEGSGKSSSSCNRPRRSTGQSDPDLDYGKPESAPALKTVDE